MIICFLLTIVGLAISVGILMGWFWATFTLGEYLATNVYQWFDWNWDEGLTGFLLCMFPIWGGLLFVLTESTCYILSQHHWLGH